MYKMPTYSKVYLLLGTNLGNRLENLKSTIESLNQDEMIHVDRVSSIYVTQPWGIADQPEFYNQVVIIGTTLSAMELLSKCQTIEKNLGRERKLKWGPRLIDIDILYFGNQIINEEDLKVPHPEIQNRKFTLVPLVELNADFMHPVLLKTNQALLNDCEDPLAVSALEKAN